MRPSAVSSSMAMLFLSFASLAMAGTVSVCSNQNTGSSFAGVANNYQSNGACTNTCSGYAFAIVQYDMCWCSNTAPGSTTSTGSCNQDCPGYPMDKCGNQGAGLYGYIALGPSPQGTAAAGGSSESSAPSQSSAAPSPQQTSSQKPQESVVTSLATVVQVTSAVSVKVSSVLVTATSAQATTPSPSPTTPTTTWTPTPATSIQTLSGTVKTIVITPSAPPQATQTIVTGGVNGSGAEADNQSNGGFFSNKGAVAGVFTVVGLIAAGLIGAAVWFFFRRHKQEQEGSERLNSFEEERGSRPPTFMSRQTSQLGLKTDLGAGATRGSDEKTPTSTQMTPGTMSRRTSIPLTDSRLNAATMFHDNGSHMSVVSLQDNQDYTRPVLQVANPDRPGSSAIEDD